MTTLNNGPQRQVFPSVERPLVEYWCVMTIPPSLTILLVAIGLPMVCFGQFIGWLLLIAAGAILAIWAVMLLTDDIVQAIVRSYTALTCKNCGCLNATQANFICDCNDAAVQRSAFDRCNYCWRYAGFLECKRCRNLVVVWSESGSRRPRLYQSE